MAINAMSWSIEGNGESNKVVLGTHTTRGIIINPAASFAQA